ncbi:MAG: bifunctional phosphopantothenoylcysteine decarboxylase/phosphopantothenate--cysteine ligase CoaBC [Candidatus Hodarchaeales archaeon]|jgi:phosphopantothenoylcysteine decarboxylase/phosphopantothenate--cysteine ligase
MVRIDVKSELFASAPFPRLKGCKILFALTGSIAAYRMVDVTRKLIRLGADVHVMMSPDSLNLISQATFEWATGNPVITNITGNVEHVLYAGEHDDHVDIMIIAPATANTISKIAVGIADTNVTLTATVAIGNNIPLLIVPGMHAPMLNNPIIQSRIKELEAIEKVFILEPRMEEGKAKVPTNETIVQYTIKHLTAQTLKKKHFLITGGPTREFLDQVRFISNPASGKTASYLSLEAWFRGASIDLVLGHEPHIEIPFEYSLIKSTENMLQAVKSSVDKIKPNFVILTAAVTDYKPQKTHLGKIRSGNENLTIQLEPTVKIIEKIKPLVNKCFLVAFKAEHHPNLENLKEIFKKYKEKFQIDLLIANDISEEGSGFATDQNHIWIISNKEIKEITDYKESLASYIINYLTTID